VRTLPDGMIRVLAPFAPLFSKRFWQHVQLLLARMIFAPSKRTVVSALRAWAWRTNGGFAATIGCLAAPSGPYCALASVRSPSG
jgi:hypothetical protein